MTRGFRKELGVGARVRSAACVQASEKQQQGSEATGTGKRDKEKRKEGRKRGDRENAGLASLGFRGRPNEVTGSHHRNGRRAGTEPKSGPLNPDGRLKLIDLGSHWASPPYLLV